MGKMEKSDWLPTRMFLESLNEQICSLKMAMEEQLKGIQEQFEGIQEQIAKIEHWVTEIEGLSTVLNKSHKI